MRDLKFLTSAALAALSLAASMPTAAGAEPKSYPIICRVGSDMRVNLTIWPHGPKYYARVYFRRGKTAAKPGDSECVWLDRAFGAKEPAVLLAEGVASVRYFADAFLKGGTFYAHVVNGGGGAMNVTRIGP